MGEKKKFVSAIDGFLGGILILLVLISALGPAWAAPEDSGTDLVEGFVYFADETGTHLKAFSKPFPAALNDHELGLALLETLLAGPPTPDLKGVLPEDTRVNALFITQAGDAYVDLGIHGKGLSDTITEYLGVYSLVNSLTLNIPAVKQVKILVNGREGKSLGRHLSLAPFFKTNMLIVK